MTNVIKELSTQDVASLTDVALLTDIAQIYAMGHNLDLGTDLDAKRTFERALALSPHDRKANYLCGMFLVSTRAYRLDSVPFLQEAYDLGEKDAQFTLGVLLVERGEKDKGIEMLEAYARDNPDNSHVRNIIRMIRDGTFTVFKN